MVRQASPYHPSLSTALIDQHHPLRWPSAITQIARIVPDPTTTYLVGGAVRDALCGWPLSDLDLVTAGDGLRIARHIADALGGSYYPVDKKRGTGRALVDIGSASLTIDVATFRGADLLADLHGRDFTINAIATPLFALDKIIDPLDGQSDLLDRRVLRQCAENSIHDDPVRALRAVRHSMKFNLRMTPDTVEAARSARPLLAGPDGLNQPERIRDEVFKLLGQPGLASALRLLDKLGLLDTLLPFPRPDANTLAFQIRHVDRFSQLLNVISSRRDDNTASNVVLGLAVMVLDRWRRQLQEHLGRKLTGDRPYTVLAVLAILTPLNLDNAGQLWANHLRLSNEETHAITQLIGSQAAIPTMPLIGARAIHHYYRSVGEAGVTGVLLWLAHFIALSPTAMIDPAEWGRRLDDVALPLLDAFFRDHQQIVSPPPLLTGNDLMHELTLKPGPAIGHLLADLLEAQAAGEIHTRSDALSLARRLLATY